MKTVDVQPQQTSAKRGVFEKVGECLYRYSTNGMYYGRVEKDGKQFRRSLKSGVFALAVRDWLISESPAATVRYRKRKMPIRKTPTPAEFAAIVANIRAQMYNADAMTVAISSSSSG